MFGSKIRFNNRYNTFENFVYFFVIKLQMKFSPREAFTSIF